MQRSTFKVQVAIADDHPIVRKGIRATLNSIPGVQVVAEAGDGGELLALLEKVRPNVVFTDISMPGIDGLAVITELARHHPDIRVIVLSMYEDPGIVKQAVANGACAYLRKDASSSELATALDAVLTTGSHLSAWVARALLKPREPTVEEQLTPRQVEVLKMLCEGKSTKEIGFSLGLSSKTVDVHRSRIMDKLGVREIASLTVYAIRKGLLKL